VGHPARPGVNEVGKIEPGSGLVSLFDGLAAEVDVAGLVAADILVNPHAVGVIPGYRQRRARTWGTRLVELLEKNVTREADVRRIKPLIATLKNGTAANATEKKAPPPAAQNKAAAATAGR